MHKSMDAYPSKKIPPFDKGMRVLSLATGVDVTSMAWRLCGLCGIRNKAKSIQYTLPADSSNVIRK